MNRRRFALAALFPAALFAGCNTESKPARDATLFHNENVREAVSDLDQAMNALEMHLSQFNAENWQDTLASAETSVTRLRSDLDQLKRALGYSDAS